MKRFFMGVHLLGHHGFSALTVSVSVGAKNEILSNSFLQVAVTLLYCKLRVFVSTAFV